MSFALRLGLANVLICHDRAGRGVRPERISRQLLTPIWMCQTGEASRGTVGCAGWLRWPNPGRQLSAIEAMTASGRNSNS